LTGWEKLDVLVVTTPDIPGRRVREVKGLVYGQSVRTRGAEKFKYSKL